MQEKKTSGVSFGFGKKIQKVKLKNSNLNEESKERSIHKDFIVGVEGRKIESTQPQEEKKPLVIPLINRNVWKREHPGSSNEEHHQTKKLKQDKQTDNKDAKPNLLENEAVKELLKETAEFSEKWQNPGSEFSNLSIPLLMKNKPPEGYETDDKLDVSIRPDEAQEADYDEVPIEQYGLAMLRGMGWKANEGIGNKMKKVTKPVEAVLRPKGQGLGADKGQGLKKPGQKTSKNQEDDSPDGFQKGACVLVTSGPHKNLYGKIEGIDEDNSRLIINLALSGQHVTLSQFVVQLVSRSDYKKYAKDISKFSKGHQEAEKRKEENHKHTSRIKDDDSDEQRYKSEHSRKNDNYESDKYRKHKDDSRRSGGRDRRREEKGNRERSKGDDYLDQEHRDKEKKYKEDREEIVERKERKEKSSPKEEPQWLRSDLRVRVIDNRYKKGKYYNAKVKIIDVLTRLVCTCRTDDGKLLEDIHQSMLETVIPRSEPGYVMVVNGEEKGQVGTILKKDKARCKANIQLIRDKNEIIVCDYNDICEFVGDVQMMEDF